MSTNPQNPEFLPPQYRSQGLRVAITGGTGSLGSAITRHFLAAGVERIVVFSRSEFSQAMMAQSLETEFGQAKMAPVLRFFLGDVRDRRRMIDAFAGCDVVVHTAALKRVDAVASHIGEVMKTNILGTMNTIEAAYEAGVAKVLFISSDKSVEPTNAYGASKQMGEHLATGSNAVTYPKGTRVATVRYGNVLGSRGSVVHLWRQRVAEGKPIQLTSREMTRFWITMPQACQLVADCLNVMDGGEIFVPILPACDLVTLATALAGPDYPIEVVGLRPGGEKLHESLLSSDEINRAEHAGAPGLMIPPHLMSWGSQIQHGPKYVGGPYTSDRVPRLSLEQMWEFLQAVP